MRLQKSFAAAVAATVAAVMFSAAIQPVEAGFIFYAEQVGADVVVRGSGSFNTTGLAPSGTSASGSLPGSFQRTIGAFFAANTTAVVGTNYNGVLLNGSTYIAPARTGSTILAATRSGDNISFSYEPPEPASDFSYALGLPNGYTSNAPLSNSMTFTNRTLTTDFGWSTAGTYASPVVNSSFTLANGETIQFVSVPEPSQISLLAGAAVTLGAWRRRRLRRDESTAGEALAG